MLEGSFAQADGCCCNVDCYCSDDEDNMPPPPPPNTPCNMSRASGWLHPLLAVMAKPAAILPKFANCLRRQDASQAERGKWRVRKTLRGIDPLRYVTYSVNTTTTY